MNKYRPSGQKPQPIPSGIRRYFICSSPHHLSNTSPQRANQGIIAKGNMGAAQNHVARPRMNACARSYGRPRKMIQDTVRCTDTATDRTAAACEYCNSASAEIDQSESVVGVFSL